MILNSEERSAVVSYRLEKSKKTIEEVQAVCSLGYWNLAANRLYYAAYYASVALLINSGIEASTHKGVIRMINAKFVKEGILSLDDSKLLGRLFTMRQAGDYDDLFDWEEKDITPLITKVEGYINQICTIITSSTNNNL